MYIIYNAEKKILQIIENKYEAIKNEELGNSYTHWDKKVCGSFPNMDETFIDDRPYYKKRASAYKMELDPYRQELRGMVEEGDYTEEEYLELILAKKNEIKAKYPKY